MRTTTNSGVYLITCKANGTQYVGQSRDIATRWTQHRRGLAQRSHQNTRLQYHADTYGIGSLVFTILQACDPADLELCEAVHMAKLKPALNVNRPRPKAVKMAEMIAGEPFYMDLFLAVSDCKRCESCGDPVKDRTNRFCYICARAEVRKMAHSGYLTRKYLPKYKPETGYEKIQGGPSWDDAVKTIEDGR